MRALWIALLLSACSQRAQSPTNRGVDDSLGRHVALGTVHRVISLAPSSTEIVYALGAGKLVIGVDRYSDYPAAARTLPQLGTDMEPNLEKILALRPDLVLVATSANSQRSVETITRAGIPVYVSRADSLEGVFADIAGIGRAIDHVSSATALVKSLRDRLAAIDARVRGLAPTSCVVIVWLSPLTVAARGSHVHDLIVAAGGRDVVEEATQPYPTYSLERLIRLAPQVIVIGTHSAEHPAMGELEKLQSIPAVRDHRVDKIEGDELFRPGPRVVDGVEKLVTLLHPELR